MPDIQNLFFMEVATCIRKSWMDYQCLNQQNKYKVLQIFIRIKLYIIFYIPKICNSKCNLQNTKIYSQKLTSQRPFIIYI